MRLKSNVSLSAMMLGSPDENRQDLRKLFKKKKRNDGKNPAPSLPVRLTLHRNLKMYRHSAVKLKA